MSTNATATGTATATQNPAPAPATAPTATIPAVTIDGIGAPEQLSLLAPSGVPLQFRLDERTRRCGLAHVAALRAQIAAQAATRSLSTAGRRNAGRQNSGRPNAARQIAA